MKSFTWIDGGTNDYTQSGPVLDEEREAGLDVP